MTCKSIVRAAHAAVEGPVGVVIMDGVGIGRGDEGDAVARAKTPYLDRLAQGPFSYALSAHGTSVGMPSDSDMGNSEVGHNALGAGRIVEQGATLVARAISDGSLFEQPTWQQFAGHCVSHAKALHLIGLLSDGNVHSHIDHLLAMLNRADAEGVDRVFVHVLLDGRDVAKTSAHNYVKRLEAHLADIDRKPNRTYRIASGGGRMGITMDRYEADWEMVARGWETHVHGEARAFGSALQAIETMRSENPGIIDQDLPAFVITEDHRSVGPIRSGDCVIAFNFRGDRMLQLCSAFEDDVFAAFDRGIRPKVMFAGMTLYDGDSQRPKRYLVAPPQIDCTIGELLAEQGVTQLACSETQKFGHVTYFWNGNRSEPFSPKLERYVEIPSHPAPFEAKPQMRANEITDRVIDELNRALFSCFRVNYANGDMVGHTGNLDATIRAVEVVDQNVGRLTEYILERRGALIVTADHGNADDMVERDPHTSIPLRDDAGRLVAKTSHSLNPVPCHIALHPEDRSRFSSMAPHAPGLGHIAGTLLTLLGFDPPDNFLPGLLRPMGSAGP
jgi:2,3-bisphosphoglycerate-independent phosphoglycerate mutase